MADTKPPAARKADQVRDDVVQQMLADPLDYSSYTIAECRVLQAELRRIPALEAERDRYMTQRDRAEADAICLRIEVGRLQECVRLLTERSDSDYAERDKLRAEVEALRADAERLDYIAGNARCDPKMDGHHVWWPTSFQHRLAGPNLRAAIDAARGAT